MAERADDPVKGGKPRRRGAPTPEGSVAEAIATVARGRGRRARKPDGVAEAVRRTDRQERVVLAPGTLQEPDDAAMTPTASPDPATMAPRVEPDEPDDMLATAIQSLAGSERQRVDFVNQVVRGSFPGGRTIVMTVGVDGMTRVELFDGMMFEGYEAVRSMGRLTTVVEKLRRTWSFLEPV